ncbi:hypothetical protein [Bradyrhizobium guangdongense]|uniref:hypothetical protein n=1 Tax=Bradyrhizobium guangdongense TaxID=1325090 RepID=UPI001319CDBD|nr:hypothetical protein [Bradyrhizobium guangdongense]
MPKYEVSIDELRACVNPLNGDMWKCAPIEEAEITQALEARDFEEKPWKEVKETLDPSLHRAFHVARIAYLASSPNKPDDDRPIVIGIAPDRVWIYDGNHRIAAAMVRGDSTMKIGIAPYEEAAVLKHFPSAKKL